MYTTMSLFIFTNLLSMWRLSDILEFPTGIAFPRDCKSGHGNLLGFFIDFRILIRHCLIFKRDSIFLYKLLIQSYTTKIFIFAPPLNLSLSLTKNNICFLQPKSSCKIIFNHHYLNRLALLVAALWCDSRLLGKVS